MVLFFAMAAYAAEDGWEKVKALASGAELRITKAGGKAPILATMDQATDESLIVATKTEQISIAKSEVISLSNQASQVPLLGYITAGQPLPDPEELATENAEFIDVPAEVVPSAKLANVYALKVRGYSMIDALINDGDIVLLRYQETAEPGEMVAARIVSENSVTLKRFYREGDKVRLQPANVTMQPIYVAANDVRIQGRVVGVLRSMM